MKRFLTTGNHLLFKGRALSRTTTNMPSALEGKSLRTDRRHGHTLTFEDKIAFLAHDVQALRMFEEKLHIPHSKFEKTLDGIIEMKINSWMNELKSIQSLWRQNKASEAMKKCDALIHQIEISSVFSSTQSGHILGEAYLFKGDFLRLTGALEKHAQEAFACYSKALELVPDNQAAKEGIENLKMIRGESAKTIVGEPDPETSYFKFTNG